MPATYWRGNIDRMKELRSFGITFKAKRHVEIKQNNVSVLSKDVLVVF